MEFLLTANRTCPIKTNGEQKSLNPVIIRAKAPFAMSTVVVESTVSFHVNKVKNNTNQCADNFCYTMSHGINTRIELNYFPFF